jgi:hypothetical protein
MPHPATTARSRISGAPGWIAALPSSQSPGSVKPSPNGVDEDCNGVLELNLDHDGDRFPRPQDCNDANPAIHPGAREIVGNKLDENCDRIVAPYPTLPSSVGYNWVPRGRATLLKSFFVRNAEADSTIRVSCRGRCAISSRTTRVKKAKHIVDLTRLVKGRALALGTVLVVAITKPQTIGSFTTLKIRVRGGPLKRERCLAPGARSPKDCNHPAGRHATGRHVPSHRLRAAAQRP